MIQLRETEGLNIGFTIQVDTLCHRIPNFIEKAAQAGVRASLSVLKTSIPTTCSPPRNGRTRSPNTAKCCRNGASTAPSPMPAILSAFPADTEESILRDVEIIKRELPLDILEFFFLTPLPGSEDHKVLLQKGVWMDPDMNKYDLNHRVSHHPRMSGSRNGRMPIAPLGQLLHPRARAHDPAPRRRLQGRPARDGADRPSLWFNLTIEVEGVHPLEGGAFRLKFRRDRRSGMKLENPLLCSIRATPGNRSEKSGATVRMYLRL